MPGIIISLLMIQAAYSSRADSYISGGKLSANQSAYDVGFYEIYLKIDPYQESISGFTDIYFSILDTTLKSLELDLIDRYNVENAWIDDHEARFNHKNHKLMIQLPPGIKPNQSICARIQYSGTPPEAKNPPWDGGFNWSRDRYGNPWVGVTCQDEGAKIWWPCKDHPSDEPDSVSMYFTVPEPLMAVSNGVLQWTKKEYPGWVTYHWKTHYPTNNYNVTVNIGAFNEVKNIYRGTKDMEIVYYVLEEGMEGAKALVDESNDMLHFFAKHFGEYPYIDEKFGLVQTDYLGMEHQTINSYGNHYVKTPLGYDFLLFHEMAHEWWGNYLTAHDWSDYWLHEGTAIYAEGMYIEDHFGRDEYMKFFPLSVKPRIQNDSPIVPGIHSTTEDVSTSDTYFKGAYILHMLRYLMGKEAMDTLLFTLVQGEKSLPLNHITTDHFIKKVEEVYPDDLQWFYDQYLYSKDIPTLNIKKKNEGTVTTVTIHWDEKGFRMPVEIEWFERDVHKMKRVVVTDEPKEYRFEGAKDIELDPHHWLLFNQETDTKNIWLLGGGFVSFLLVLLLLI